VTVFSLAALAGVALSASISWGHPILASRWGLFWRLCLWAATWVVTVVAALHLPRRVALGLILGAALAVHVAALAGPPTTSDDLYRYAWDGRVQLSGTDPYAAAPTSVTLARLRQPWLWPDAAGCAALHRPVGCTRINRPGVRTIYPPVAEAWFTLVSGVGGAGSRSKPWQVAGLVTEAATVGLLLIALRRWNRDPRWVALYALSPFPVLEIVNNAHVDGLAVALILGAVVATGGGDRTESDLGRDVAVGVLLGAAALVKLYPALLLAAVPGWRALRPWRSTARATLAAAALAVLAYLPHVVESGWRVVGYLPGYLREEHYEGGGRFLLASALGLPGSLTTAVALTGLAGAAGWVLWRRPAFPVGVAVLLAALFLTTTPVQPWYATSLLAVATVTGWAGWVVIPAAGYPYFFAVILADRHAVGLGRASYGIALAILVVAGWRRRRRGPGPDPIPLWPPCAAA
jgi:hypothetical protein